MSIARCWRVFGACLLFGVLASCAANTSFTEARTYPVPDIPGLKSDEIIAFKPVEERFVLDDMDAWRNPRPAPSVLMRSGSGKGVVLTQDTSNQWVMVVYSNLDTASGQLLAALEGLGYTVIDPDIDRARLVAEREGQRYTFVIRGTKTHTYLRLQSPAENGEAVLGELEAVLL